MNYIKAAFHLDTEEFIKDIFMNDLAEIGFDSFEQTSLGVIGYCQENIFEEKLVRQVIDNLLSTPRIKYRIDKIEDRNWNEIWEQNSFKPINIEDRVFIRSSKENAQQKFDYEIIINPKQSFGTGGHETTELIISQMLKMNSTNNLTRHFDRREKSGANKNRFLPSVEMTGGFTEKSVLDLGCGTAVLAILAAKMGAKNVVAVDIDNWAIENSIENIAENQVVVETILGDIHSVKERKFDIIFANINRNILLDLIPFFSQMVENTTRHCGTESSSADPQSLESHVIAGLTRNRLKTQTIPAFAGMTDKKGVIILSGFLEHDIKILEEKANQHNLYISEKKIKNEWAMLVIND